VLSAHEESRLLKALEEYGIARFFSSIAGSDNIQGKSKEEKGLHLMEQLKQTPRHCLMVGDTLHDAEVARKMGVECLLFTGGHFSVARLKRGGMPLIQTLDEVHYHLKT